MTGSPAFAVFQSSGGAAIHRLPLEVFPNFWAYVYVVRKDEYCVRIDAGSGTDTSHEHLVEGLKQIGLQPSDLLVYLCTLSKERAHVFF